MQSSRILQCSSNVWTGHCITQQTLPYPERLQTSIHRRTKQKIQRGREGRTGGPAKPISPVSPFCPMMPALPWSPFAPLGPWKFTENNSLKGKPFRNHLETAFLLLLPILQHQLTKTYFNIKTYICHFCRRSRIWLGHSKDCSCLGLGGFTTEFDVSDEPLITGAPLAWQMWP